MTEALPRPPAPPPSPPPHTALDDAQALLTGTLFVSLGLALFRHAGLVTGGTAGLAFVAHYATAQREENGFAVASIGQQGIENQLQGLPVFVLFAIRKTEFVNLPKTIH